MEYFTYNTTQNAIAPAEEAEAAFEARRMLSFVITAAAVLVVLRSFKTGRKLTNGVYQGIDRLFGGAAHTVKLPGPVGYPLVGNLYQVRPQAAAQNDPLSDQRSLGS